MCHQFHSKMAINQFVFFHAPTNIYSSTSDLIIKNENKYKKIEAENCRNFIPDPIQLCLCTDLRSFQPSLSFRTGKNQSIYYRRRKASAFNYPFNMANSKKNKLATDEDQTTLLELKSDQRTGDHLEGNI